MPKKMYFVWYHAHDRTRNRHRYVSGIGWVAPCHEPDDPRHRSWRMMRRELKLLVYNDLYDSHPEYRDQLIGLRAVLSRDIKYAERTI
jgi:hypothetical protein